MIAGCRYEYILDESFDIGVQIWQDLGFIHLANGFEDTGERMDVSVEIGSGLCIVRTLLIRGDEHVNGTVRSIVIE